MPAYRDLLDASVWVPLAAPDHLHHRRARLYWDREGAPEAVFCRVTALAFLRHLMNPHILRHAALTASEAWEHYCRWREVPGVQFLDEPIELEQILGEICQQGGFSSRGLTDAYLAAFARAAGCRLVSFDADFRRFSRLDFLELTP